MKRLLLACLLVVLAAPAFAVIGTVDDVPAATLLLPYFEVDLDNPDGVTTLMSINNASAGAVLAHVVLWTDLSVHVLDFNIYLTGYDVQTINLRDILVYGNLPLTADDGNDTPQDTISPQGIFSDDDAFPSCDGLLPYSNPALSSAYIDHVQSALTGQASDVFFAGKCSGIDHGDRIARGYVTVDTVSVCSTNFPTDDSYFLAGGTGTATNQNYLWGDYFIVNTSREFADGDTLVHIEAAPFLDASYYTFYYRYTFTDVTSTPGADQREGLGNIFAVRYVSGGGFDGGSSLLTWRDSKLDIVPFSCTLEAPNAFPLGQRQVVVFDEQENPEVPGCQISPCPEGSDIFPWETQRTLVGGSTLPTTEPFGWMYLNLNDEVGGTSANAFSSQAVMQNWVSVVMDANAGHYSVGFKAIQLGNVTGWLEPFIVTIPGASNDCLSTAGPGPCPAP